MRQANEYTAIIRKKTDGDVTYFEGTLKEFGASVISDASTPDLALNALYENGEMMIADMVDDGDALPEIELQRPWEGFSGKITVRIPKSLHYKLHVMAEDEGVSLNSMLISILSWGAERKHGEIRPIMPISQHLNVSLFDNGSSQFEDVPAMTRFARMQGAARTQMLRVG